MVGVSLRSLDFQTVHSDSKMMLSDFETAVSDSETIASGSETAVSVVEQTEDDIMLGTFVIKRPHAQVLNPHAI